MMKLLAGMTVASVVALVLCVGLLPAEVAEGRVQLDDEGLAIYGTVMVTGTRDLFPGVELMLLGGNATMSPGHRVTTTTGPDGRFSFTGLAAGHYDVGFAYISDSGLEVSMQPAQSIDLASGPPPDLQLWQVRLSGISGRVTDSDGEPIADARVSFMRAAWYNGERLLMDVSETRSALRTGRTDEDGFYTFSARAGAYYLQVRSPGDPRTFPPQYYPGVLYPIEAALVQVRSGVDLSGMDIVLTREEQFRVTFRHVIPDYVPGGSEDLSCYLNEIEDMEREDMIKVSVKPTAPGQIRTGPYSLALEASGSDEWLTSPLPQGEYDLVIGYAANICAALNALSPVARLPVVVDDEDVDLGTLPQQAKTTVEGRIILQTREPGSIDLASLPEFVFADSVVAYQRVQSGPDGTFSVRDLPGGRFAFSTDSAALPDGWYVAGVTSGGQDVLRNGLLVGGGQVGPLVVVLADDAARIDGVVRNADNGPVPNARVVLVPEPGRRGPMGRFPSAAASPSAGYVLDHVPPGRYRLLALDDAGRVDYLPYWEDPDFLREYELRGERITVDPGARMTINAEAIPIYE